MAEEKKENTEDNTQKGTSINLTNPEATLMLLMAGVCSVLSSIPIINIFSSIFAWLFIGGWSLTKQAGREKAFGKILTVLIINVIPVISSFATIIGLASMFEVSPGKPVIPPVSWLGYVVSILREESKPKKQSWLGKKMQSAKDRLKQLGSTIASPLTETTKAFKEIGGDIANSKVSKGISKSAEWTADKTAKGYQATKQKINDFTKTAKQELSEDLGLKDFTEAGAGLAEKAKYVAGSIASSYQTAKQSIKGTPENPAPSIKLATQQDANALIEKSQKIQNEKLFAEQQPIHLDQDITKEIAPEYHGLRTDTKFKQTQRAQNVAEREKLGLSDTLDIEGNSVPLTPSEIKTKAITNEKLSPEYHGLRTDTKFKQTQRAQNVAEREKLGLSDTLDMEGKEISLPKTKIEKGTTSQTIPEELKTPSSPLQDKSFDAEKELKNLKNLSKEERKTKVKELKEELVKQKIGIGRIIQELRDAVEKNPNISQEELEKLLKEKETELKLTKDQINIFRKGVAGYLEKHKAIEKYRQIYSKDSDFFEACFGKKPIGKIKIIKSPMTLLFRCYDIKDFAFLYFLHQKRENNMLTKEDIDYVNALGGFALSDEPLIKELNGIITVEKQKSNLSNIVKDHEDQHQFNKLFVPAEKKEDQKELAKKFNPKSIREFVKMARTSTNGVDSVARDEILAYYKDGSTLNEIFQTLSSSETYDFSAIFNESIRPVSRQIQSKPIKEKVNLLFSKEYKNDLIKWIVSVKEIENKGYSRKEVLALLYQEPVNSWANLARRLPPKK